MPAQELHIPVYYIRQIADQLASGGVDVARWLQRNGLDESQLSDTAVSLPFAGYRQLILDALASSREAALGLLVGERLPVNTHGIVGFAAMNSGTLRQAVEMIGRFVPLRTPLVTIAHAIRGQQYQVHIEAAVPLGDVLRLVMEAVTLSVKNLIDYLTGSREVQLVSFALDAPPYARLAQDLFKCEVRFGQSWTGFVLPLAVMDLPLKMADPTTFKEVAAICQQEFDRVSQAVSLAARVRHTLLQRQNGFPSLQVVARLFNLTPRTLHRRLQQEDTSFKAILEEVRHVLAVEHLKSGQLTIQEVAYALGYTDIANFRRAFKRWEGLAPSSYRAAGQAAS
jgi:AraC-like DNA-binding protein